MVAQQLYTLWVGGSNPSAPTISSVPSDCSRIVLPRHVIVFPANDPIQMPACSKSFSVTSQKGEIKLRSGVKRRCKLCARQIRTVKNKSAVNAGNSVVAVRHAAPSHKAGHKLAFAKMLKKYGTGWQTRIVRPHRS